MRIKISGLLLICLLSVSVPAAEQNSAIVARIEIAERLAEYAYRWDSKNADEFIALFSEGAVFNWVIGGTPESRTLEGRTQIKAYAEQAFAERIGEKQSRHHFSNLTFRALESHRAVTENLVLVTHQHSGQPPANVASGYYRIIWIKRDDQWLIAERTLHVDR